jgi:hypothetical protein
VSWIVRFLFGIIFSTSFLCATETVPPGWAPEIKEIPAQIDLKGLCDQVSQLIHDHHLDPHKIAVVLDLNGTLMRSNGQELPGAVECVQHLKSLGVLLVISSAQRNFKHTLRDLTHLGLANTLEINETCSKRSMEVLSFSANLDLEVFRCGKVASVHRKGAPKTRFFDKAFAIFAAYGEQAKQVEYVFFADDSEKNRSLFKTSLLEEQAFGSEVKVCFIYQITAE